MRKKDYTASSTGRRGRGRSGSRYQATLAARRRRRLAAAILLVGVIVAATVFLAIVLVQRSRAGSGVVAAEETPDAGDVLLVGRGDDGSLQQLLLLSADEAGGYGVVTIPPRTVAAAPGGEIRRLDEVYSEGGREALVEYVAGLLQVEPGAWVEFDESLLRTAAEAAGGVDVRAEEPLATADGAVSLDAGDTQASPDEAVAWLAAAAADPQAGPAITPLFYRGLVQGLASLPPERRDTLSRQLADAAESNLGQEDLAALIMAVTAGDSPFGAWALPVRLVGGGDWYLEPLPDQVEALLMGSNAAASYSLEVRNGTGIGGAAPMAAALLEPLRYNITVNDEVSGVDYSQTQIRCGSDALAECDRVRGALGTGTVIKDDLVDRRAIVVIVGRDLAQPPAE